MAGVGFAYYHAKSDITCPYALSTSTRKCDVEVETGRSDHRAVRKN